ncbi:MAG: beta-ketoacyl-[acyl-carrier-protein] synthase family protein [Planctomycetaceae bacterium]|nr:beta-ketoacyl-[acyl-carrier-protein] synthase family protein [Planctomycetaceae bacterium]
MPIATPRRVVITGLGLISPLGNTVESFWDALTTGRSGVRATETLPADLLQMPWAAEAREFTGDIADFGPLDKDQTRAIRKGIKVMCREIQMGVAAAQRALADAGLRAGAFDVERTGVVFGCDYVLSGPDEFVDAMANCLDDKRQFDFQRWAREGIPRITPLWLLKYLPNMPASHIAIYNDLRGPSNSLTMREASSLLALAEASRLIARRAADVIVAGATGTRVHPLRTLHVVLQEEIARTGDDPSRVCRPFDLHRTGMVLGEGAGAVVLESLETAQARGAQILAEVVGSGSSAAMDTHGVGDLRAAIRSALRQTLRSAGMDPADVGHVHAHGLSTRRSDAAESQAIQEVLGARSTPVPVTAAKSYLGNPGAAGGVIELIASVLALQHNRLFPVLNYETPDPQCPVHVVASADVPPGDAFLSISVTPTGQASSLAVRRFI